MSIWCKKLVRKLLCKGRQLYCLQIIYLAWWIHCQFLQLFRSRVIFNHRLLLCNTLQIVGTRHFARWPLWNRLLSLILCLIIWQKLFIVGHFNSAEGRLLCWKIKTSGLKPRVKFFDRMAADVQQAHRPGALKQQNKSHKHGKHKSKGQLDKETKGN